MSYFLVAKDFTKTRKAAGLPESLVFYSTRHSFATDLLDRTGNLVLLQKLLGHESPHATQRYLHPDLKGVAKLVNERNNSNAELLRHSLRHSQEMASEPLLLNH
jgi:site-specific recombinase XerD